MYSAFDPDLDRKVALKLLRAKGDLEAGRAHARLLGEVQALGRLSHRNVVAVHDVGTFRGQVFIAMEFVDGETLTRWLAERTRPRSEILSVFSAAARGLAAAHAAGLVHRDFKPGNVMIARDGSVRVTDFGLEGELLGTPHHLAPEQLAGRAVDARTDQFSFCVALYRALYGAPPFRGDTSEALAENVLAGRLEPPPPRTTVPLWQRRVLLRALSVEPAARWPSMSALEAALGRDPGRTRRRFALAAGALSLVALSVLTLARGAGRAPPLCVGGPARLAAIWEGAGPGPRPRRDAVENAFLASGAPGARDVWDRVAALLDRYRDGWLASYRDACEATQVRHAQGAALLDLRMSCLDERRLALSALTNVLVSADRDVVDSAVDAANALPALARCADRKQLEARTEPPRDDATRARVDDVRRRAAVAKALNDTGKREEARQLLFAQLAEARALGYRPLVAEELSALGRTFIGPSFRTEAVPIMEEGVWTSLAIGRDDLAAEAAIALVYDVGYSLGRYDEGRAWTRLAHALLDRAGEGHELLRAWLLANSGTMENREGHVQAYLELTERALAIKQSVLPPNHPDIAGSIVNEADALAGLGRTEDALRLNGRALELYVRAYGPASTDVALALNNRGEALVALGRPREALEPLRRSLAIWEPHLGPEHHYLGFPLTALGRALLALERPREAVPPLERALRVREAGEGNAGLVAETRFALARALSAAGVDRARAAELARKARAAYVAAADEKHAAEVSAWLAASAKNGPSPRPAP